MPQKPKERGVHSKCTFRLLSKTSERFRANETAEDLSNEIDAYLKQFEHTITENEETSIFYNLKDEVAATKAECELAEYPVMIRNGLEEENILENSDGEDDSVNYDGLQGQDGSFAITVSDDQSSYDEDEDLEADISMDARLHVIRSKCQRMLSPYLQD